MSPQVARSDLRLRQHQQENLDFFRAKARALSLLPFGAGKTAPTILRIGDLINEGYVALIVTTTGTIYKWLRDLKRWGDPRWVCVALQGKRDVRVRLFGEPHNIAVINYEGLRVMIEALGTRFPRRYRLLVFDEIHRLKAVDTQIAQDAAYVSQPNYADFVYGLTGSPVLESPRDLYPILRVVNPRIFPMSYEEWLDRFFSKESEEREDGTSGYPKWQPKPGATEYLTERLHSISFRRERDQIQVDYPDQNFHDPIVVEMKGRTRSLYEKAEKRLTLDLRHQSLSLVSIYPRLEKLCQLSRGWCYDLNKNPILLDHRPAQDAFASYMEDVRGRGRVVAWAVRAPDMAMIAQVLDRQRLRYRIVFGGIRSLKKRDEIVSYFNNGNADVLIAHPRCIGEGTDIEANFSFRYSYRWSANEWKQPLGRIARLSSAADWVTYSNVVVKGTVDEGIIRSVQQKLDIGDVVCRAHRLPWRYTPADGVFDDGVALSR